MIPQGRLATQTKTNVLPLREAKEEVSAQLIRSLALAGRLPKSIVLFPNIGAFFGGYPYSKSM